MTGRRSRVVVAVCMIVGGVGLFVLSVFALWVLP